MWQSAFWNGQCKAVMFVRCSTPVLIVLLLTEESA
jgi:predicted small integral membrane protein